MIIRFSDNVSSACSFALFTFDHIYQRFCLWRSHNHYLPLVTNNNYIINGGGGSSHLYQLLTSGAGDCKKNGDASAIKQGCNSLDIFLS